MSAGSLIKIRESTEKDFQSLMEIAVAKLGVDFATYEQFYERGSISLVAECDNKVVAYGTAAIISEEVHPELAEYMSGKTGMLCTVAVANGYEGRGIASRLADERLQKLKSMGCDTILVTAWRSQTHGIHVEKILDRLGFEIVEELSEYWKGYSCSHCGENNCTCDAVIFRLEVDQSM